MAKKSSYERFMEASTIFLRRVVRIWKYEEGRANRNLEHEFRKYQREKIEIMFMEAVNEFYNSYSPNTYVRQYGLLDVLSLQIDENGEIARDGNTDQEIINKMFNPSAMHKDRHGGDLFNKVFVQGWHGGAESGTGHPHSGVPYYRTPYPYFSHWGNMAVKTASPFELLKAKVASAETDFDIKYDQIAEKRTKEFYSIMAERAATALFDSFRPRM